MGIQNVLLKTEPTYFPFQVVKSDDGGGNLVAYDSGNPTTGWTAPMATPFSGLWVRVEFSDYYVNFKHNGTTWVEYNKEKKIQLYGTTEFETGFLDDSGNTIYGKTWNITGSDVSLLSGVGNGYITNLPKADVNKIISTEITGTFISGAQNYTSSIVVNAGADKNTGFTNIIIYALSNSSSSSYKITIYYTKN